MILQQLIGTFFFVSQVKILRGSGARDDDDGWMMG
jgi:hypothetical protein